MFEGADLRTTLQTLYVCTGISQKLTPKRSFPMATEWSNPKSSKLGRITFKEEITCDYKKETEGSPQGENPGGWAGSKLKSLRFGHT